MSGAPRRDIEGEIYSRLYGGPSDAFSDSARHVLGENDLDVGAAEVEPRTQAARAGAATAFLEAVRQALGGGRGPGTPSPSLRRRRTFATSRRRRGISLGALGVVLVVATMAGALAPDPAVEEPSEAAPGPEPRAAAPAPAGSSREKGASRRREEGRKRGAGAKSDGASGGRSSRRSTRSSDSGSGAQAVTTLPDACSGGGCYVVEGAPVAPAPRRDVGSGGPGEVVTQVPQQSDGSGPNGYVEGPSVGGSSPGGGVEVEVEEVDP